MKKIILPAMLACLLAACNPYHFDETHFIELKKDPCFGVCPVYTFRVNGLGKATFTGTRNVAKEGNWSRTLTPDEANALFDAFEASNFAQFQDEYTAQVTDLPTTWVTFGNAASQKTVKDYFGAPEALKNLEKMAETIAEAQEGWVKND